MRTSHIRRWWLPSQALASDPRPTSDQILFATAYPPTLPWVLIHRRRSCAHPAPDRRRSSAPPLPRRNEFRVSLRDSTPPPTAQQPHLGTCGGGPTTSSAHGGFRRTPTRSITLQRRSQTAAARPERLQSRLVTSHRLSIALVMICFAALRPRSSSSHRDCLLCAYIQSPVVVSLPSHQGRGRPSRAARCRHVPVTPRPPQQPCSSEQVALSGRRHAR